MTDYISREAVKDAICVACSIDSDYHKCDGYAENSDWCDYMVAIRAIPAADVRPVVRGKWISVNDGETIVRMKYGEPQNSCKCSVCGEWLVASDEYAVIGNFCPNCGADMREES